MLRYAFGLMLFAMGVHSIWQALRAGPLAIGYGTELRVCHAQHIHGEEITMYPGVEDVWTNLICGRSVVVFQIFKAHISRKAKKRYGHSLWMNVPGSFHEARVIPYAAVHLYQGIDAKVSCCRKQARSSAPAPAHHGDLG
jgi:hypothetical protein